MLEHFGSALNCRQVGHPDASVNVYDRKVILMDEVHHLVRTDSHYSGQLAVLRELLSTARESVLVGFTGTPLLIGPVEGRRLMDVIKGLASAGSDEGFLSSLSCKPAALFPVCVPSGVDSAELVPAANQRLCCKVALRGEALQSYVLRSCTEVPRSKARLQAYCNLHLFSGAYHDGRHGCRQFVLNHPQRCAPKFWKLAQTIAKLRQKSLVFVSRGTGYRAALDVLRHVASRAMPPFRVASVDNLAEFNSPANLRGESFLCMVADSSQCGEGVSFRTVRQLFLLDVPRTPTSLVQICGRASRMLGHQGLPRNEWHVRVHVFVATLPEWARQPLGHWCLLATARRGQSGGSFERHARCLFTQLVEKVRDLKNMKAKVIAICKKKASQLQHAPDKDTEDPRSMTTVAVQMS